MSKKIENFSFSKETDVLKIAKKDFIDINKEIKKFLKEQIKKSLQNKIIDESTRLFVIDTDNNLMKKVLDEVNKYLNGSYLKQLLDNIDFKILVKDTTLINGVKEQAERYLFTWSNSRLLKEDLEK